MVECLLVTVGSGLRKMAELKLNFSFDSHIFMFVFTLEFHFFVI